MANTRRSPWYPMSFTQLDMHERKSRSGRIFNIKFQSTDDGYQITHDSARIFNIMPIKRKLNLHFAKVLGYVAPLYINAV